MNELSKMTDYFQKINLDYGGWVIPPVPPPLPLENPFEFQSSQRPRFHSIKPGRSNWKANKTDMRNRKPLYTYNETGGYKILNFNELPSQNCGKPRRFHPKRKFSSRFAPFAPRNTTSFIIRAKKYGGVASRVSPCPLTPAILPTPIFSPSRELLVDMAKEKWGVDGYGSMNGLIRVRSPKENEEEEEGGCSSSVELERRLDYDLSRFEMIYPNNCGDEHKNFWEKGGGDQGARIAQLEEENWTLKERLFLMERELEDLRRRVHCLETDGSLWVKNNNDEASGNEGGGDICSEKSVGGGD